MRTSDQGNDWGEKYQVKELNPHPGCSVRVLNGRLPAVLVARPRGLPCQTASVFQFQTNTHLFECNGLSKGNLRIQICAVARMDRTRLQSAQIIDCTLKLF